MDINKYKSTVDLCLSKIKDHYAAKGDGFSGRNKWIHFHPVGEIYVIVNSQELIPPSERFNTLSRKSLILSNISFHPDFVGKGIYRYMLADLEGWADDNGIYLAVENIAFYRFLRFHQRRGYMPYQPCSFYREPVMQVKVA